MRRLALLTLTLPLIAAAAACAPSVLLLGVVTADAPDCELTTASPAQQLGLLDVGFEDNAPFAYQVGLLFSATADDITFESVEVYFTTDADRGDQLQLQNAGTPVNENTARRLTVSGTSANELIQAEVISREDAAALAAEPFVVESLVNANSRVRINAHVRLIGATASALGSEEIASQELSLPVELCRGCLVPVCAADELLEPSGCILGQDDPAQCVAG